MIVKVTGEFVSLSSNFLLGDLKAIIGQRLIVVITLQPKTYGTHKV
jgi:hypothetical protein